MVLDYNRGKVSRRELVKSTGVAAIGISGITGTVAASSNKQETKAKKARQTVKKEVQAQKHRAYLSNRYAPTQSASSTSNVSPDGTIDPRFQLYLGSNETIYDAGSGDSGKSSSGWAPASWGSSYDTTDDQAEAAIVTGGVGAGNGEAWAYIGREIYVNGSGSSTANIIGRGDINGVLTTGGAAASSVKVSLVVIDYATGGTRYDNEIYSKGDGGYQSRDVNDSFNNGMSMVLEGGHSYMMSLEVDASCTLTGTGEAGSDFGDGDGDGGDTQGVFWTNIEIRF